MHMNMFMSVISPDSTWPFLIGSVEKPDTAYVAYENVK